MSHRQTEQIVYYTKVSQPIHGILERVIDRVPLPFVLPNVHVFASFLSGYVHIWEVFIEECYVRWHWVLELNVKSENETHFRRVGYGYGPAEQQLKIFNDKLSIFIINPEV